MNFVSHFTRSISNRTILKAVQTSDAVLSLRDHNLFTDIVDLDVSHLSGADQKALAKAQDLIKRISYGPRFVPVARLSLEDNDKPGNGDQVKALTPTSLRVKLFP